MSLTITASLADPGLHADSHRVVEDLHDVVPVLGVPETLGPVEFAQVHVQLDASGRGCTLG